MKHKAQESLDNISQIVLDEIADGYIQPRTVHDFYYGDYSELEDLINCQLTVDELDVMINTINSTITMLTMMSQIENENRNQAIEYWTNMLEKFKKQKEMWVK